VLSVLELVLDVVASARKICEKERKKEEFLAALTTFCVLLA